MAFSTVIRRAAAPSLFRPSSPALSSAFRLSPLSSLPRSPPPASAAHLSPPPASAVHLSRFSSSLLPPPPPAPAARRSPPPAPAVRPTPPSSLLRFSPYSSSLHDIPRARFTGEDGRPQLLSVWHVVPSIIIPHPNEAADALDFYTQALDAKVTYNSGPKPPGFFLAYINLYTNFGYCIFAVKDTVRQRSNPLPVIGYGMIEIQCDDSEAAEAAAKRLVDCGGKRFEYPGAPSGLHVVRDPYNIVWRFSVFRDY